MSYILQTLLGNWLEYIRHVSYFLSHVLAAGDAGETMKNIINKWDSILFTCFAADATQWGSTLRSCYQAK